MAIAILAFFGEDRYGYMLGMSYPPLWFLIDIVVGGFSGDFRVLIGYFTGRGLAPLETPLHGLARLTAVLLVIASFRAWRKTVPERLLGKTLLTCALIAAVYASVLAFWYVRIAASLPK